MEYLPYNPDRDEPQFTAAQSAAFDVAPEHMGPLIDKATPERIRVVRENNTVVGGLFILPFGQWWQGHCVPTAGIAAVAVAPHMRGRGVAGTMMRGALREARDQGTPLSALYPASVSLYRKFGYELAGSRFFATIRTTSIPRFGQDSADVALLPITESDEEEIQNHQQTWAADHHGHLRRIDYLWNSVMQRRGQKALGFCVREKDNITGHIYYRQERSGNVHHQRMIVSDLAYSTPAAAKQLLTFISDHRSLIKEVSLPTGPNETILALFPELQYKLALDIHWMVRILDVPAAFQMRGYPETANGTLHFDIADDLFPENTGKFILNLVNGTPTIEQGGDGTLQLDIRTLTSLYTGFSTATDLAAIGKVKTTPDQATIANSIFAAPYPWMRDQF